MCTLRYCTDRQATDVLLEAQQSSGRDRNIRLIGIKGSRCEKYRYSRNRAALEFHHIDPDTKRFQPGLRSLSSSKWDVVLAEPVNCRLLCFNCHAEIHNPDCKLN